MKNEVRKNKRKNGKEGITLIALVITIIILLILAGISIVTLTGENGILNKARKAKEENLIEQYKEEINLIIIDEVAERKTQNKDELMIVSLNNKIGKKKEEWVNEIYKCNSKGEEQSTFEASTHLLVESKEHYEYLIEVNKEKQTAKIVSFQKGTGEKYTVTYHPNGGDGKEERIEIRQGFSITLKECNYTKNQYKFVGWCENQNGEGKRYLEDASYKPEGQVTLYAIWELNVATITFNSNNGTNNTKQVTISKGKETELPANTFTRRAYQFSEWNTKADGSGTKYEEGDNINIDQDIVLYAIWKPLVTPGEIVTEGNKEYSKNGIAVIPEGFIVVPGCDDVSEGLVISDNATDNEVNKNNIVAKGNQFVWIPVKDETIYERNKNYSDTNVSNTAYNDTGYLPDGITNEEEAVRKVKGFYIARYEAGIEETDTLVSKKDATIWENISQTSAKEKAKTISVTSNNVKGSLISGIQWDLVMKFISSQKRIDGLGNEYDVTKPVSTGKSSRHTGNWAKAGANEADKVCNIYDLEGNAYEYIAEKCTYFTGRPYIVRGGFYDNSDSYSNVPASYCYGNGDGGAYSGYSFRIILYVVDED